MKLECLGIQKVKLIQKYPPLSKDDMSMLLLSIVILCYDSVKTKRSTNYILASKNAPGAS